MGSCDFIAGWGGGVLGLVTGHPFDTVKVNQQTKGMGLIKCVQRIHNTHGIKGYFRGLAFPLLANGTLNSIFFGVYGHTIQALSILQYFDRSYAKCQPFSNSTDKTLEMKDYNAATTYLNSFLAGCVGGVAQLTVACPVDVVKIKLQTTKTEHGGRGPLTVLHNILKSQGPRGLYQGLGIMTVRDVPASGVYMLLYTVLSDGFKNWEMFTNQDGSPNSFRTLMAGGVAGTVSWWTILPVDVIKSRMQADDPMAPKYRSIKDCVQKIFKAQGYAGFFKGFWTMSLRAFPVNGVTFLAYEWISWTCVSVIPSDS